MGPYMRRSPWGPRRRCSSPHGGPSSSTRGPGSGSCAGRWAAGTTLRRKGTRPPLPEGDGPPSAPPRVAVRFPAPRRRAAARGRGARGRGMGHRSRCSRSTTRASSRSWGHAGGIHPRGDRGRRGEIGAVVAAVPEVKDYQIYAGTASPYNFNGTRPATISAAEPARGGPAGEPGAEGGAEEPEPRDRRPGAPADPGGRGEGRSERQGFRGPPGPPVLQTLVAEVYGPDYGGQIEVARRSGGSSKARRAWWTSHGTSRTTSRGTVRVDREKAALNGVSTEQVAETLRMAVSGTGVGLLHRPREKEDVRSCCGFRGRTVRARRAEEREGGRAAGERRGRSESWCG
jgi:hypothetical protein